MTEIPIEWFSRINVGDTHAHIFLRKLSKDDVSPEEMQAMKIRAWTGQPEPMPEPDVRITRIDDDKYFVSFSKGALKP
jgi:hypothetical protein